MINFLSEIDNILIKICEQYQKIFKIFDFNFHKKYYCLEFNDE